MSVPSKPPTFPATPKQQTRQAASTPAQSTTYPTTPLPRPNGAASGGPASLQYGSHTTESVTQVAHIGRAMAADTGISTPALLGYITSGLVLVFGAGGMVFSDMPGELKKQLAAGYAVASVGLVLSSSFVDSHHKISMRS